MARSFLYVFSYDVRKDSVRRKVAERLEGELARVQMSVFEGRMTKAEAHELSIEILSLLEEGDSLRVYAVTPMGLRNSIVHGGAPLAEDHDFWIV